MSVRVIVWSVAQHESLVMTQSILGTSSAVRPLSIDPGDNIRKNIESIVRLQWLSLSVGISISLICPPRATSVGSGKVTAIRINE